MTVEVAGQSATGRNLYEVVINALETKQQRRDYRNWQDIHEDALDDPKYAQRQIGSFLKYGDDFKIPIFVQGGIHGDEYEGVDASMQIIERLATDAVRHRPRGRRDPRPPDRRLQPDPEPRRPRRRARGRTATGSTSTATS